MKNSGTYRIPYVLQSEWHKKEKYKIRCKVFVYMVLLLLPLHTEKMLQPNFVTRHISIMGVWERKIMLLFLLMGMRGIFYFSYHSVKGRRREGDRRDGYSKSNPIIG